MTLTMQQPQLSTPQAAAEGATPEPAAPAVDPMTALPPTDVFPLAFDPGHQPPLNHNPQLPPPLIVIYGVTKVGKTTLLAETFPLALCITRPGGMLPTYTFLGLNAQCGLPPLQRQMPNGVWTAHVFEHLVATLDQVAALAPQARELGFPAIIIDDASLMADTYNRQLGRKFGSNGFKRYEMVGDALIEGAEGSRQAVLPVGMSTHVRPPETQTTASGTTTAPGGPLFPSRNLTPKIVAEADLVGHMRKDPDARGFGSVLDFTDPNYLAGDRLACMPLKASANLRGPMVHAGYHLPRYPGLEWQDAMMVHVADRLQNGEDFEAVARDAVTQGFAAGKHIQHLKWALRDGAGLHQARLRSAASWFDDLFSPSRKEQTGSAQAAPGLTMNTDSSTSST